MRLQSRLPVEGSIFGVGWVLVSATSAALLGSAAVVLAGVFPLTALILWALSGFGVGAAQWLLIRRRLDVSFRWWVVATGCGAFVAACAQFYFGLPFSKAGDDFPHLIGKFGYYRVLLFSAIVIVGGGLALGVPQIIASSYAGIRWRAWLPATMVGLLVVWLSSLGFWSALMELVGFSGGHWPRPARLIGGFAGYWAAISFPQAFVIGFAVKRRTHANGQ